MFFKLFSMLPLLRPIPVEQNITIPAYLGRWKQVATSRSTALFGTGIDYQNVSAVYDIQFDKSLLQDVITVFNSGIDDKGNYTSISGYSYITGKLATKRKLHFDGVPVDGNYWIVKLGPIENNEYQYAIISGPVSNWFGTRFSLYVLARNSQEYVSKYEITVKNWCKENGFTLYWNEYIATN